MNLPRLARAYCAIALAGIAASNAQTPSLSNLSTRAQIGTVLERLAAVRAAEAALEAKVKAGLEVPDFVQAILDTDRVIEI